MKIKAAVVPAMGQDFEVKDVHLDDPKPNEILVKIVGAGLCHTDLTVKDHFPLPIPSVLGHEGAGVVEKVGAAVTKVTPGDHVVLSYASCGSCNNCLDGAPGYCDGFIQANMGGMRLDGTPTLTTDDGPLFGSFFGQSSFGSYALATERNTVKVTKDVPLELLGPLGCGIQTGAGSVLVALNPPAGSSIAVFGAGSVGLSAVMGAVIAGCTTIIAVDVKPERLAMAEALGATHTINATETNPVEAIQALTGGGVNYSLETSGLPSVYRQAVDSLALRGVCGLVGAPPQGTEVSLDVNTLLMGRSTRGIIEGDAIPQIFIPQMIELYQQGRFPFDKLIKYYDFDDINQAVADSESGSTIKPILRFG